MRVMEKAERRKNGGGRLVFLGVGREAGDVCSGGENTCGDGQAMRVGLLMALDARNKSGEKEAAREAAVRHVLK